MTGRMVARDVIVVAIAAASLTAQSARRPTFDAASIKPSASLSPGGSIIPLGDRLVAKNVPLRPLVQYAYRWDRDRLFFDNQILGLPAWANTDRFEVQAKAADGAAPLLREFQAMTQTMLEDRFQLKTHREMRERPIYVLVVGKGGIKMKPSGDQTPIVDDGRPRAVDRAAPVPRGGVKLFAKPSPSGAIALAISGSAVSASRLINVMEQYVDRPLIDETRLDQLYELQLEFGLAQSQPATSDDAPGVSLFTAVQEQLGLRLEAQKKSIEVIVVDHVEHPSPD